MSLATFGDNQHAQLGHRACPQSLPLRNVPLQTPAGAISLSAAHTVVLTTQGEVWCAGDRDKCGVANGTNIDCSSTVCSLQKITALRGVLVTRVGAGASHSMAVGSDRSLYAWGTPPAWTDLPSLVGTLPAPVQTLACGAMHTLLLLIDGRVFSCGENFRGGLGLGLDRTRVSEPTHLAALDGVAVRNVAAGGGHSLASTHTGAVYSWGDNRKGQLGVGDTDSRHAPVQIVFTDTSGRQEQGLAASSVQWAGAGMAVHSGAPAAEIDQADRCSVSGVTCGDYHSLVMRGGTLWTFGCGFSGQLGLGDFSNQHTPRMVQGLPLVQAVAAGGGFGQAHTLVLSAAGDVYGFGSCARGQLGIVVPSAHDLPPHSLQYKQGTELDAVALPVLVDTAALPEGSVVKGVGCGWLHSALLYETKRELDAAESEASPCIYSTPDGVFSRISNDAAVQFVLLPTMLSTARHQTASCEHATAALCSRCSWCPVAPSVSLLGIWAQVSRLWRDLSVDDRLWQPLFEHLVTCGDPLTKLEIISVHDDCPFKRLFADRQTHATLQKALKGKTGGGGVSVSVHPSPSGLQALAASVKEKLTEVQGSTLSRLVKGLWGGKTERKLVWVGLDAAGRTTGLMYLACGELVPTIPTIGFNVESIEHGNTVYTIWDAGGGDKIRPLYVQYCCPQMAALGWWVDSSDRERIAESKYWLHYLVQHGEVPMVIVYASKQDLPNAMSAAEMVEQMDLHGLPFHCGARVPFYVQPCMTMSDGEGLRDAFDWLEQQL